MVFCYRQRHKQRSILVIDADGLALTFLNPALSQAYGWTSTWPLHSMIFGLVAK
ncbi:hypothetical protein [Mycobacterium arosiense]|uniref:hypothetical protein n=1 Tax=Mycobacterium arosiense TaxID=425468 RepID=UPI001472AADE|nr:hypothetical protein [Mycobacterium arosiense]